MLGEFVHPARRGCGPRPSLAALAALDVEEKSARQALTRTAAEGLLESARHGRRVLWELTPPAADLLEEGTRRIYGFMRDRHAWDGRWLVLSVAIPESQRQLRHRLRTRLTWLGLGLADPGAVGLPRRRQGAAVREVVARPRPRGPRLRLGRPGRRHGDERLLLAQAWDLDDVERRYLEFLDEFESREADGDTEAFVAQVQMIAGVAPLPVPRPRPARASCSTTTGRGPAPPPPSTTATAAGRGAPSARGRRSGPRADRDPDRGRVRCRQ